MSADHREEADLDLPEQVSPAAAPRRWLACTRSIPSLNWGQNSTSGNAESEPVLIYCAKRKQVLFGRLVVVDGRLVWLVYSANGYVSGLSENAAEVTHWMPFPKPPMSGRDR